MAFDWSTEQRAALEVIARWQRSGSGQVLRVFGYAGTGKTTIIKHLVEAGRCHPVQTPWGPDMFWSIRVAAFTGKAAQVMRTKSVQQASTIHRMIYRSREQSEAELLCIEGKLKGELDRDERRGLEKRRLELIAELNRPIFDLNPAAFDIVGAPDYIIIDECSMLGDELSEDLLSFGLPVMVFGDPMQLGPIGGDNIGYFMRDDPDVMLEEIHRQAEDNPIIQMATDVRSGEGLILPHGEYGESSVVRHLPQRWWEAHDQLLVGTNISRDIRNREARRGLGFSGKYPMIGERLVCLKNNHERGLLNGSLWRVEDIAVDDVEKNRFAQLWLSSLDIPDVVVECSAWKEIFSLGQKAFGEKYETWNRRAASNEFDFGYALTVNKAQGSEWDDVVMLDESRYWRKNATHRNWLYTGITRAAKKLTLVRPEKFWRC